MQKKGPGRGTVGLVGFCLVGYLGMDLSAQAADYTFQSIVDNGPGSRFGSPFATAISSNGLVAFLAFPPGFAFGMYSSAGGNPTPILETLQAFGDGGINSSGTVAFILEAPGSD